MLPPAAALPARRRCCRTCAQVPQAVPQQLLGVLITAAAPRAVEGPVRLSGSGEKVRAGAAAGEWGGSPLLLCSARAPVRAAHRLARALVAQRAAQSAARSRVERGMAAGVFGCWGDARGLPQKKSNGNRFERAAHGVV